MPFGEDEDMTPENPYNELGFGFTAYFSMLRIFIGLFILFSLIMVPTYYIYGTTEGLHVDSNPRTEKAQFSLGNLGFSGATCISQYVELKGNDFGIRELVCL